MAERQSISKKTRFEVFKRDHFTCQYCGRSAPDVVLEIDHINPVVNGGDNDIMNLLTSCFDCNRGKGKRLLTEAQEMKAQREQLKQLSDRREQLEMMIEWRKELSLIEDREIDAINALFKKQGVNITDIGKGKIRSWLKKFSFQEVYDCTLIVFDKYFNGDFESLEEMFSSIPKLCYYRKKSNDDPTLYWKNYILKAARNNLSYIDETKARRYLDEIIKTEDDFEEMKMVVKYCRSWYDFKIECEERMCPYGGS